MLLTCALSRELPVESNNILNLFGYAMIAYISRSFCMEVVVKMTKWDSIKRCQCIRSALSHWAAERLYHTLNAHSVTMFHQHHHPCTLVPPIILALVQSSDYLLMQAISNIRTVLLLREFSPKLLCPVPTLQMNDCNVGKDFCGAHKPC